MCGLKSVNHFFGYLISGSALSRPFQLLGHVPRERAPFETPNSPFKQCGESILAWAFFAYILFDFYTSSYPVSCRDLRVFTRSSGTERNFQIPSERPFPTIGHHGECMKEKSFVPGAHNKQAAHIYCYSINMDHGLC